MKHLKLFEDFTSWIDNEEFNEDADLWVKSKAAKARKKKKK